MSQYPHDEFDDVAPYRSDEIGKHRGSAGAAAVRRRGGLKAIGVLAVLALLIGAGAYFYQDILGGDDDAEEQASESDADEDGTEEDEEGSEEDAESDSEADSEEGSSDEDEEDASEPLEVFIYNFDGTEGAASNVSSQLQNAGVDVAGLENWSADWGTCGESAPVVLHPAEAAEQAGEIAEQLGAATCENDAWTQVAVAVGANSMQ